MAQDSGQQPHRSRSRDKTIGWRSHVSRPWICFTAHVDENDTSDLAWRVKRRVQETSSLMAERAMVSRPQIETCKANFGAFSWTNEHQRRKENCACVVLKVQGHLSVARNVLNVTWGFPWRHGRYEAAKIKRTGPARCLHETEAISRIFQARAMGSGFRVVWFCCLMWKWRPVNRSIAATFGTRTENVLFCFGDCTQNEALQWNLHQSKVTRHDAHFHAAKRTRRVQQDPVNVLFKWAPAGEFCHSVQHFLQICLTK